MALYEANFMKLCQLVECLEVRAAHDACGAGWPEISVVAEDCTVYFAIQNRSKYTCEVRLTYLFDEFDGIVSDPDLVARVYFDARMVEVIGWR